MELRDWSSDVSFRSRNNDHSPRFQATASLQSAKELAEQQTHWTEDTSQAPATRFQDRFGLFDHPLRGRRHLRWLFLARYWIRGPTVPGSLTTVSTTITPLLVADGCQRAVIFLQVNVDASLLFLRPSVLGKDKENGTLFDFDSVVLMHFSSFRYPGFGFIQP